MGLDRRLLDHQMPCDLRVGQTLGEQSQHVELREVSRSSSFGVEDEGWTARVNWAMKRRVTDASMRASPAAAARTLATYCSGGASFSMKPLAAACNAP